MTEKELRRLGKTDLLTILRDQQAEIETLQSEKGDLQEKLQAREISLDNCGSIAEATLALNDVFGTAQRAADQYLASIKARQASIERELDEREAKAAQDVEARLAQTETQCRAMKEDAAAEAEAFWTELEQRLERYYNSHEGLREMLVAAGIDISISQPKSQKNELEKDQTV